MVMGIGDCNCRDGLSKSMECVPFDYLVCQILLRSTIICLIVWCVGRVSGSIGGGAGRRMKMMKCQAMVIGDGGEIEVLSAMAMVDDE